jgi:hypothetical protein
MALFVRTIGLARAQVKIGMANLAYNFTRSGTRRPKPVTRPSQQGARHSQKRQSSSPSRAAAVVRGVQLSASSTSRRFNLALVGTEQTFQVLLQGPEGGKKVKRSAISGLPDPLDSGAAQPRRR